MVTAALLTAIALAAADAATTPTAEVDVLPARADSRPASSAPDLQLQLNACLEYLKESRPGAAAVCYREIERHAAAPGDAEVAAALAAMAVAMSHRRVAEERAAEQRRRDQGSVVSARYEPDPLVELFTSGKLELVLAAGGYGLWVGGWGGGLTGSGGGVLAIAAMSGLFGMTAAVLGINFVPAMSAGDANLLRSSMYFGFFNSISALVLLGGWVQYSGTPQPTTWALAPVAVLGVSLGSVGAAAGVAALTDIPPGNVALAVSGGFWSAILTAITLATIGSGVDFTMAFGTVTAVADLAYLGLLVAAPVLPVTRFETWVLDAGALCGLMTGAALAASGTAALGPAFPLVMIATTVVGAGGGLVIGHALQARFADWGLPAAAPETAVWPWLQPGARPEAPIMGAGLRIAL